MSRTIYSTRAEALTSFGQQALPLTGLDGRERCAALHAVSGGWRVGRIFRGTHNNVILPTLLLALCSLFSGPAELAHTHPCCACHAGEVFSGRRRAGAKGHAGRCAGAGLRPAARHLPGCAVGNDAADGQEWPRRTARPPDRFRRPADATDAPLLQPFSRAASRDERPHRQEEIKQPASEAFFRKRAVIYSMDTSGTSSFRARIFFIKWK